MQVLEHVMTLAPEGWRIDIIRKSIRHVYFRVDPGRKKVRISVPKSIGRTALAAAVSTKSAWLLKQMNTPVEVPDVSPEMTVTDTAWYKGRPYPVRFVRRPEPPGVIFADADGITVHTRPGSSAKKELAVLDTWYRNCLRSDIQTFLDIWEPRIGVHAAQFGIRRMKTRWGSCNVRAARIWLNLALIRLDPVFLEYVVVHELVHLLEARHNKRFYSLMNRFLPGWKSRKKSLDQYRL